MAYRLQERAAGVGFDWPDSDGPMEKVREEVEELSSELADPDSRPGEVEDEIGDLFFAAVNLARKLDVDPRSALERANAKFEARFRQVERTARERGIDLGRASLEELDKIWEEIKAS
jgi:uncharacterized protein YabN with tetrapyrrole methylase and pyrophosphatase domain